MSNEIRRVIIGSQNTEFAAKLKKFVEQSGFKVLDVVVVAEHLIESIEESYNNDEPIYGLIITTDLAYKQSDKRLEFLSDCLVTIRTRHSDIKMAILANEGEGHPLLAELVGVGIYNIFVKSSANNSIDVREIIQSFEKTKEFAEVAKYREYRKDILWRKIDRGASELTIRNEKINPQEKVIEESSNTTSGDQHAVPVPSVQQQKDENKRTLFIDDDVEDYKIPFPVVKEKIVVRDRIFGSVVVALIGVSAGAGTTHSSVSVANYLARKGNRVALVECNDSGDFKYIELSYEGVKDENRSLGTKSFEIDGVNYFKSDQNDIDLISLLSSEYNFIVLDLGCYETTAYFEEFLRSDIQIVVSNGIEWKQRYIKKFISATTEYEQQTKWNIALPFADNQTRADVEGDLKRDRVFVFPYHTDPFKQNDEMDAVIENILKLTSTTHMPKSQRKLTSAVIVGLVLLSTVLITLLLLEK